LKGFYAQVAERLRSAGFWLLAPGKGSQEKWTNGRIKLIVSRNGCSRHAANAIMRDAGLDHRF
jgi:hypothetical protein